MTALKKLADELVTEADAQLPLDVPERQHVLDYLGELAENVTAGPPQNEFSRRREGHR
jgi:hypothetical protein